MESVLKVFNVFVIFTYMFQGFSTAYRSLDMSGKQVYMDEKLSVDVWPGETNVHVPCPIYGINASTSWRVSGHKAVLVSISSLGERSGHGLERGYNITRDGTLIINKMGKHTHFECYVTDAENHMLVGASFISLIQSPRPPRLLRVVNRTEYTLLYEWNGDENNSDECGYNTLFCEVLSSDDCKENFTSGLHYLFENLKPGGKYMFMVQCVEKSHSMFSQWKQIIHFTKPASPTSYGIQIIYNVGESYIIAVGTPTPLYHDKLCLKLRPVTEMFNRIILDDVGCMPLNKAIPIYMKRGLKYNLEAAVCIGDLCSDPSPVVVTDYRENQNKGVIVPISIFVSFFLGILVYANCRRKDIPFDTDKDDDSQDLDKETTRLQVGNNGVKSSSPETMM